MANHLISYLGDDGREVAATFGAGLPVHSSNVANKFREAFETYMPNAVWTESKASGDIVQIDGNAASASYLVVSKDPLTTGVTTVETIQTFQMPFDVAVGLSLSQRTLGQEFSIELVSTEESIPTPENLAISSVSQATTTLTVTTAAAIQAAGGASLKRHITAVQAINTGASTVDLIILDGETERWRLPLPVNVPVSIQFPTELVTTANTALNANLSAVGTVRANFQGYTSA